MATRTKPAEAAQPEYEPDALYTVTLTRVVPDSPIGPLSPAHATQLKGKHIAALGDAVAEAVKVDG